MSAPQTMAVQQIRKIAEITGFKVERTVDSLHHFRVTTDYGVLIFHFCETLEDAEKLAHIIVEKRDDFEGICLKMEQQLGYCK